MKHVPFTTRYNLELIEHYFERWQTDPSLVDERWQAFFEGFALADQSPRTAGSDAHKQTNVVRLIFAYRDLGHFLAHTDPLSQPPQSYPLLQLDRFELSEDDLDRVFDTSAFYNLPGATLRELIGALQETYCRTIGVEFTHIQDLTIRNWLRERMEPRRNHPNLSRRQQYRILMKLHFAELFENFLQARYLGQKRFSLEGAETIIPMLDALVEKGPDLGVQEYIMGMAHRGRLNVLANIIQKPYEEIFAEFEDNFLEDSVDGDGDVKYHLGFSGDVRTSQGQLVHLSLSPNPSHLEAVDPVVEGRTRSKQRLFGDTERTRGVPVLVHGDAAFAGQGIVAETFNLSALRGFRTGGTIHLIVNNQIGFTTAPYDARSTTYPTDIAKMIQAPIFHVNAEDPEAAVFVTELALEFRQTFHRDVLIDLVCYRRHGHNEGDEPTFTHPTMYRKIKQHPSITTVYTHALVGVGTLTEDEANSIDEDFHQRLQQAQQEVKTSKKPRSPMESFTGRWQGFTPKYSHAPVETGVPLASLLEVGQGLLDVPEDFQLHSKIARLHQHRRAILENQGPFDWGFAELLAFGTLVIEGTHVRLSGQDSGRGTFSSRHGVLTDMHAEPERDFIPLKHLRTDQATFDIFDSMLSEGAVLGFEFGYSLDDPHALVLWEAQFGDFANGAQSIIDQFIVCSESKWQRSSGLVLLLPHGYEGQGPEHSSARLERFLQACAEDNIQVCNLTTPAQYFHVLRRQVRRPFRKPLIIMTPKSLLRHKEVVSNLEEFTTGRFHEVLDDPQAAERGQVRRVILCSGKVYYDLLEGRRQHSVTDTAIVRVEQFYPYPEKQLTSILQHYPAVQEHLWVQEEPQNMGGWTFMEPRLRAMGYAFDYVGRDASASPATGSLRIHNAEQKAVVLAALGLSKIRVIHATRDADRVHKMAGTTPSESKNGVLTSTGQ